MAENQSAEHKEAYWRRVVLKWVKCADLNTSHESIDLDTCYTNFRCKIKPYYDLHQCTVVEFLRVQFPEFELELNKENEIPKCDAVYVFSLMLYFSCIRHPIPYFQNIGQEFDVEYQQSMTAFLNSFVSKDGNQIVISRSFLDKAFHNAKPTANVLSENSCNRRDLSQQMITSTPSGKLEMKKPSPTTPKSVALEWKLKNLNALLETAQAENINQDRQIERLLQNVKELQEEKKMYQSKINILQLKETCACGNNLPNLPNASNRVTEQLQKQLESKDNDIDMLQEEISKLKEIANTEMERYMSLKKQYAILEEDNQRMKITTEDLKEEISIKESCNQNLFEIVKDLRRFINENQIKGAGLMEPLESSFEFLEQSFKNLDDSQCYDSENLASTVVDIKLKEKEHELEAMAKKSKDLEDNLKAMIENLNRQLESQKKAHLKEHDHLKAEFNEKDAKLRQSLAEAEKEKSRLVANLEKGEYEIEDLNRQLREHERLVAELTENNAQLQQVLANAEKEKSRIAEHLQESKALIKDLNSQLESQKKIHMEEHARLQAEMNEETSQLRQALAETEKEKSQLTEDFEKAKINIEDLNRQLQEQELLEANMSQETAKLRQALAEAEKDKSQLAEDLEKGNTKTEDLNRQLKEHERLVVDMRQEIADLRKVLAEAEKEKSQLTEDFENGKIKMEDLNRKLQEHERLVVELTANNAQLQQVLANAEKEKSRIAEHLQESKALIKDLNSQLESQKKIHMEEHARLQAEMNEETSQLRQALAETEKEKSQLTEDFEKAKINIEDLNRQLQEQELLEANMSQETAKLRQALAEAEKDKSQLAEDLEKGNTKTEDLNRQLKEHERLVVDMRQEIADLRKVLAEAEKEKSQLTEDFENGKIKMEDLNRKLQEHERLVVELTANNAQLQQVLANAEKEKSRIAEHLQESKALIKDLNSQLESQKKIHMEEHARLQAEMNEETSQLRQALAETEKEKSQLTEDFEKAKINIEDLNRQLQAQELLEANMSQETAKLRQALAEAEKDKSQLAEDLEKGNTKTEDLNRQLKEHERLVVDMRQEIADLRKVLAEAEKEKSQLTEDFENGKIKMEDLNRKLQEHERLVVELTANNAQLQQVLANAEKEKSRIAEHLQESKALIKDLNSQLESQKKIHMEEHARLQAEMNEETSQLRQALAETKKEKSQLTEDFEKAKINIEDLNRQLQEQELLEANMSQETAKLRQALAETEKDKSQLAEDLEKGNTKTEDLNRQLKEHERLVVDMRQEIAELRKVLAEAEKEKSQLTEDFENGKIKMEDLNRKLQEHERLVAELNENTAQLQQASVNAAKERSQLTEDFEKGKALINELNIQLESQKKAHLENHDRLQLEMTQETAGLREKLAESEKEKSQLTEDLEKSKAKNEDLNRQLQEHERVEGEMNKATEGLHQALVAAEKEKSIFAEDIEKDKAFIKELNTKLQEQERLLAELNEKNAALAEVEKAKLQLDDDLGKERSKTAYLNHLLEQAEKTKLLHEQSSTCQRNEMVQKISTLQQSLDQEQEKSEEINCQYMQAKRQADDLDVQCTKLMEQLLADRSEKANLQQQLAAKDAQLNELSVLHEEKAKQFEKSYQHGEILAAKLFKARQMLKEKETLWEEERASMANAMEEKLRDARIEHDSKMAKMKDRMVELHKEGKTKLECDNQGLLLTVDGYRRKVENLEIRCAKLQQQLAEMNERNLEVRKENQLLLIRIKSLDELGNDRKSVLLPTQANLRNNFKMEDEEGELFNNMYLADLKSGRCVSPGGPSTTKDGLNRYAELSQRNSMLLPHLRTNYVALEPNCEPPQDDTRDNMSTTFDDSSTGLISRRKVSGITSYKRPGPPTPSKRAGRLSLTGALSGNLGGEVQYKEVLRDANANVTVGGAAAGIVGPAAESAARTARTKTPGKFKQMISSSSLLNNFQRDEGNTSAPLKGTANQQRCAMDTIRQKMASNTRTRLKASAAQKRLQRKLLFDSNRFLGANEPSTLPFTLNDRTTLPLGTILECPLAKDEQDQILANCNTLTPETTVRTTTDYYSSRTSTLIDTIAAATTSSYGCSQYNILRKQELRREKRRELYDKTRKLVFKGSTGTPVAMAFGSPKTDLNSTRHSMDVTTDHTEDITLYYSFNSAVPTVCPMAITGSCRYTTSSLQMFLLFAAWFGMLAMLMFCLGDLDPGAILRPNGRSHEGLEPADV